MYIHELAAIGAATCWALSGIISANPSRTLGALRFSSIRMVLVLGMLGIWVLASGGWQTLHAAQLPAALLSGVIGIFLGDAALFATMNRMGPRRTGILFAMNAPMAVVLGWLFLDEQLSLRNGTGILLCIGGVLLAIVFGKRRSQIHQWESISGSPWTGIALGLGAALAQATGALIVRPVMQTGADPATVSCLRVLAGVVCLNGLRYLLARKPSQKPPVALTPALLGQVALSGFIAMALGMTLLLFGLAGGKVGIITTLSAMAPVILLPLLWLRTGEVPAAGAWIGAVLVVAGCGLIFNA
ncbi:MAG: DMT family transporter [Thiothrix sp.]|nr:DMT family transporter [Thiothrix sp.]HPE62158.1 DMT family transporter [Thiolinea sp.]